MILKILAAIIGFLLDPILIPTLAISMHIVAQKQLKGEEWTFGSFFSGFQFMWPMAGRALLLLLVPIAILLPPFLLVAGLNALFGEPPPIILGIGFMLMAAAAGANVYVFVRLVYFSHFLIIDRKCGEATASSAASSSSDTRRRRLLSSRSSRTRTSVPRRNGVRSRCSRPMLVSTP